MTRSTFGGTTADTVAKRVRVLGHDVDDYDAATLTVWSAQTGGTQYTDLLVAGSASSTVPVDATGQVPEFQGPDGVVVVWVSAGGARVKMLPAEGPGDNTVAAAVTSGTQTKAALSAAIATPRGEDARSLGIPTDGITDCAADLAAIPANTGRVILRGKFVVGSQVSLAEGVHLDGGGARCSVQPTFGGATWAAGITGTQLVFTNAASAGLLMPGTKTSRISRLALIGPGSGTAAGLQVGEAAGTIRARLTDVMIGNFATGLYASGMMNSAVDALFVTGCQTGLKLRNATNGNAFTGINIETCSTAAIDATDATVNTFSGGVIQGNTGTATVALGTAAHANIFTGVYFENPGATYSADLATGADFNQFVGCHFGYSATSDKIRIASNHNLILTPETDVAVAVSGASNILIGSFGTITNTGTNNVTMDMAGGLIEFGARDMRISTGNKFYLEAAPGVYTYVTRETATGDLVLSAGSAVVRTVAGNKLIGTAGLGCGNSAAATTLGSVVKKMEVFNASGVSLGFVPIYNTIT